MDSLRRDVALACRSLRMAPGFTVTALVTLALGAGATTAVFSVLDAVVLRPLPYAEPARLVTIWEANREKSLEHEPISPVNFLDYRAQRQLFTDAAAWWRPDITLQQDEQEPVRLNAIEVSGNFLAVLGVQPALGAGFPAGGPLYSRDRMVLISDRLWRHRFAGDPAIVGRPIRLNGALHTVAGVMPRGFHFPGDTDLWQRLVWDMAQHSRAAHFMESVGRLAPGVDVERAERELRALSDRLGASFPSSNDGWHARVISLHREIVGLYGPALFVLFGAVAVLLLIACLNVSSLLLARGASRLRETAVCAALGATRWRLIRQSLTESVSLALAGTILGVLVAYVAVRALVALTPMDIPRLAEAAVSRSVLLLSVLIIGVTTIAFGLLPAVLQARTDPQQALREGGRAMAGSRSRGHARRLIVSTEVALAVALLAGSSLLVRSLERIAAVDPGFEPRSVISVNVLLTGAAYRNWPSVAQAYTAMLERLREQPGVEWAGASNFLPLAAGWRVPFLVTGAPARRPGEETLAQLHTASEGYFETLGVPLRRGRLFSTHDGAASRPVVVVNETLARMHFPGQDPVGRTIQLQVHGIGPLGRRLTEPAEHEIIGVVGDLKNTSLQNATEPAVYFTQRQFPFRTLYLQLRGPDTARLVAAVKGAVRAVDPSLPLGEVRPLGDVLSDAVAQSRFLMFLMGVFAILALTLAAIGVYGQLSFAVVERQQEISIRMALGAAPRGIIWLVLQQGVLLASIGCVAGIAIAAAGSRALSSFLYEIRPGDPLSIAAGCGVTLAAAALACTIPAWRASRVDPIEAIRL